MKLKFILYVLGFSLIGLLINQIFDVNFFSYIGIFIGAFLGYEKNEKGD